jgi:hypothetical protein
MLGIHGLILRPRCLEGTRLLACGYTCSGRKRRVRHRGAGDQRARARRMDDCLRWSHLTGQRAGVNSARYAPYPQRSSGRALSRNAECRPGRCVRTFRVGARTWAEPALAGSRPPPGTWDQPVQFGIVLVGSCVAQLLGKLSCTLDALFRMTVPAPRKIPPPVTAVLWSMRLSAVTPSPAPTLEV